MPKKRVMCPECGHIHTVRIDGVFGQTAGVRFKKITENQFQQTINTPGEIVEYDRYYTLGDQLLAAGAVGISAGVLIGFFISAPWHLSDPGISSQVIIGSALIGWTISWSWLAKERAWQLGTALPMAVARYLALANERKQANGDVQLTVDHRHRDGHTEAGRTINRFGVLPVDVGRFNEWIQGALVGKSLAVPNWTPRAKLFTRPEYDLLLAKMKAGGLVIDLGSNKGNTLTGGGRRALTRHLADYGIITPSPASEKDFLGERLTQAVANNGGNTPLPRSGVRAGGLNE